MKLVTTIRGSTFLSGKGNYFVQNWNQAHQIVFRLGVPQLGQGRPFFISSTDTRSHQKELQPKTLFASFLSFFPFSFCFSFPLVYLLFGGIWCNFRTFISHCLFQFYIIIFIRSMDQKSKTRSRDAKSGKHACAIFLSQTMLFFGLHMHMLICHLVQLLPTHLAQLAQKFWAKHKTQKSFLRGSRTL